MSGICILVCLFILVAEEIQQEKEVERIESRISSTPQLHAADSRELLIDGDSSPPPTSPPSPPSVVSEREIERERETIYSESSDRLMRLVEGGLKVLRTKSRLTSNLTKTRLRILLSFLRLTLRRQEEEAWEIERKRERDGRVENESTRKTGATPLWLDYGTLLGAERDGMIIKWDHDVDVSVPEGECMYLRRALRHTAQLFSPNDKLSTSPFRIFRQNQPIRFKHKGRSTVTFPCARIYLLKGKYIDIYEYQNFGEKEWRAQREKLLETNPNSISFPSDESLALSPPSTSSSSPSSSLSFVCSYESLQLGKEPCQRKEYVFPLRPVIFENFKWYAPHNTPAYLEGYYGKEWRTPLSRKSKKKKKKEKKSRKVWYKAGTSLKIRNEEMDRPQEAT